MDREGSTEEALGADAFPIGRAPDGPLAHATWRTHFVLSGVRCSIEDVAAAQRNPRSIVGYLNLAGRSYVVLRDVQEGSGAAWPCAPPPAARPSLAIAPLADLLTARELQIAELIAVGRCNKEIARSLGVSVWTVSTHMRRIFSKLDVRSRTAVAARVLVGRTVSD